MSDEKDLSESDAHLLFARQYHGKTWDLLDKQERSLEENERMLDYAHASLAHWREAGTAVNIQRGGWLLSRVWVALGDGAQALRHARRTQDWTEANRGLMQDFDVAFAYESLSRAHALLGNVEEARRYNTLAQSAGEAISDEEDRKIFFEELKSGNWNGLK